jgi:hypothetical protein
MTKGARESIQDSATRCVRLFKAFEHQLAHQVIRHQVGAWSANEEE